MHIGEIIEEKANTDMVAHMSDQERLGWITFIIKWLRGDVMKSATNEHLQKWEEFSRFFPTGVTAPKPLYRLITIPQKYLAKDEFDLQQPAPGPVGSWTSTKVGLDSVAGVARDFAEGTELQATTARIAIGALIKPEDLLVTIQSLKKGFLALTHDYEYREIVHREIKAAENGQKYEYITTTYPPYLGDDSADLHDDLSYYVGLFASMVGGPYRQYEHIVRTAPVRAKKVLVYRDGNKTIRYGNDDPHN